MAISGEDTHLGSSCLATLTKSSLSDPVEVRVEKRRGGLRKGRKSVQDGTWVECQRYHPKSSKPCPQDSHWDSNWPLCLPLIPSRPDASHSCVPSATPYPEGSCSLEVKDVRGKKVTLPWLWRVSYGNRRLDFPRSRQMAQHPTAQWLPPKLSWHEKKFQRKKINMLGFPNSFPTKCFTDPSLETSPFLFIYSHLLSVPPPSSTPQTLAPRVPNLGHHEV